MCLIKLVSVSLVSVKKKHGPSRKRIRDCNSHWVEGYQNWIFVRIKFSKPYPFHVCWAEFVFIFVCFVNFTPFWLNQMSIVVIWCLKFDGFPIYSRSIVCLFVRRPSLFGQVCFAKFVWPILFVFTLLQ